MPQDPKLRRGPDYYAARAVEERRLAMAAKEDTARRVHLEMAAGLATGGALSHDSAAALWGFRAPSDGDPHVTVQGDARSRAGEAPEGRFAVDPMMAM